ncbi:unnamed protein product [Laminaria digitata]
MFTFITPEGLWKPLRMPPGCCNATAHFVGVTDHVLGPLIGDVCVVYVDDIVILEHLSWNWSNAPGWCWSGCSAMACMHRLSRGCSSLRKLIGAASHMRQLECGMNPRVSKGYGPSNSHLSMHR